VFENQKAKMVMRKFFRCWFNHHTTNGHQFTMFNRHQELTSPEQTASELAIPGQTATGKESSNPFMAGSLPKTIHFCDSLQSDEDNLSTAAKRFSEDASKQGRIHDAYAAVTKEQKVNDDKETAQEVTKCLDTSS
ncbi:hypothetical protein Tco_1196360, partial [Tanacetum coccineum]